MISALRAAYSSIHTKEDFFPSQGSGFPEMQTENRGFVGFSSECGRTPLALMAERVHDYLKEAKLLAADRSLPNTDEKICAWFETDSMKQKLAQIARLDLSGLGLQSVPPEICYLPNLCSLELKNNRIKQLPKDLEKLECLESVDLSENAFSELPAGIAYLKQLKELDLSHNELKTLSQEIENLAQIETLKIGHNHLSEFSMDLGKLTKLKKLYLQSNCLAKLPEAILSLMEKGLEVEWKGNPGNAVIFHVSAATPLKESVWFFL